MEYLVNVIIGIFVFINLTLFPNLADQQVEQAVEVHSSIDVVGKNEVLPEATPITTPVSSATHQQANSALAENYLMEPHPSGKEGFYIIRNAPVGVMSTREELDKAVQNYRKSHNLNQIKIDDNLCLIAHERAVEASQDFSHDLFQEKAQKGEYNFANFTRISENLWDGSFSGVHIVEYGWDRSPGHRANLQGPWTRGCGGIYGTTAVYIFAN